MINKQIERVERPSPERFYRAFVLADKPVIITGAMEEWKARSLWTIDYLKERLGRKQVTVLVSPDGVFNGDPVKGYSEKRKHMGFDDYLDLILQTSNGKEKYYLQQNPMSNFPELAEDIESPDHFKKENLIVSSLWFGPGGSVSPLHFDLSNNLLAQVKGRKRLIIYSPSQFTRLYPHSAFSPIPHLSQVNTEKPDLVRFPKFEKAEAMECILEPGEILYIPSFWWHQVYTLDLAISIKLLVQRETIYLFFL